MTVFYKVCATVFLALISSTTDCSGVLTEADTDTCIWESGLYDEKSGRCFKFDIPLLHNVDIGVPRNKDDMMLLANYTTQLQAVQKCKPGRLIRVDNIHIYRDVLLANSERFSERRSGRNYYKLPWIGIERKGSSSFEFEGTNKAIDDYYTAWKSDAAPESSELCVSMDRNGLRAQQCSDNLLAVCEYTSPKNDQGCPLGFFQSFLTGKCYMIRDDKILGFQRARRECYKHGADIYMPNSMMELNFMRNFKFESSFWIGLTDLTHENRFFWVNGYRLAWSFWREDEPNNFLREEHCADTKGGDRWNDNACNKHRNYICQRPKFQESERGGCPGESWRYVETGRCYTWHPLVSANKSEAFEYCNNKGGFLAAPPDGLDDRFQALVTSFYTDIWYDGSDEADQSRGRPICEFTPPQNGCPTGYFKHDVIDSCFRFEMTQRKTWQDARDICIDSGGDLIRIDSKKINDFIAISTIKSHWIGATRTDAEHDSDIRWARDNSTVSGGFTSWCRGTPSGHLGSEDCAWFFDQDHAKHPCFHTWAMDSCSKKKGFICQYDFNNES